jgi:hypothetical protein
MLVELLEPMGIIDVALPSRNVLDVGRIDQKYFEPTSLQKLIHRNPLHTGRFHRDSRHPNLDEPIGEPMQIAREASKDTHGFLGSIRRDSYDEGRTHVKPAAPA